MTSGRPATDLGPDDLVAAYYTLARADREGRARVPFPDRIRAAAAAGFAGIGVQPHDYERSIAEGLRQGEMLELLAGADLSLVEVDGVPWWPLDGQDPADLVAAQARVVEWSAELGARHLVAPMPTLEGPPDRAALARRLADVGRRAGDAGMSVGFEFLPWTPIHTLADAREVIEAADEPHLGLTVDFWHLLAGGSGPDDLAGLPAEQVVAVHLTDGHRDPTLDPLAETMVGRRLPGDGEFDVVGLIRALDALGSTAPITVETVSLAHRRLDVDELAGLVYHRVRAALDEARAPTGPVEGRGLIQGEAGSVIP